MDIKKIQENTDGILSHEGLTRSDEAKAISSRVLRGEISENQGKEELLELFPHALNLGESTQERGRA